MPSDLARSGVATGYGTGPLGAPINPERVNDGDDTSHSDSSNGLDRPLAGTYHRGWVIDLGADYDVSYLEVKSGAGLHQPTVLEYATDAAPGVFIAAGYSQVNGSPALGWFTWNITGAPITARYWRVTDAQTFGGVSYEYHEAFVAHTIKVWGEAPLAAAFTGTPLVGDAPLTVVFTNTSSGDIVSQLWDFGDGTGSTAENPTHVYTTPGTYTVSLTVHSAGDEDTLTRVDYVHVGTAPLAWDVYAADDPNGDIIATLDNAKDRFFRVALDDEGSGGFRIAKSAPEATADVLAKGNIVKVRIPEVSDDYLFAFILERGDFELLSSDEEGGEELEFGGKGVLAYLDRAVMWDAAYTTGLDISDTWTKLWANTQIKRPVGAWYDSATPTLLYVMDAYTKRLFTIDQSTHAIVSSVRVTGVNYPVGLSGDPSDATIYWVLDAPWRYGGASSPNFIRKVNRATDAVTASYALPAGDWSDIKVDASNIWLANYSDGKIHKYTLAGVFVSSTSISYQGTTQTHMTAVSINGTSIGYWFLNKKRVLIADVSAPGTITRVIKTEDIAPLGGEWTTESAQDYFYMCSDTLHTVWKYQVTSATPHDPVSGTWRLDEATPGAILWRIILECQAGARPQQPLPDLTYAFTSTLDSDGNAWNTHAGTAEFDANVGDSVFATALRLVPYELKLQMSPDLVLGGYNSFGTDRSSATFASGKVRFEVGVNIALEARKSLAAPGVHSHLLAQGDGPIYATATDDDLGYVQEGFLPTQLKDAGALAGTATAALADERQRADSLPLAVLWGDDELAGLYLPGPAGTNGHYWVGDTVRVHTGEGETDENEQDLRIAAISLSETDTGEWDPVLELAASRITTAWLGSSSTSGSSGSTSTGGSGSTGTASSGVALNDSTGGVTLTGIQELTSPDWVIVETTAGEALVGIRWPTLDQLADVDASDLDDAFTPVWDDASASWVARLAFPFGSITAAQLTAAANDYAPAGIGQATLLRLSTDASRRVTGILAPTDADAILHIVANVGAFPLVLGNADTGSAAANRILCGGSDVTLAPDQAILIRYDPDAASGVGRWLVIGGTGSGTGGGGDGLPPGLDGMPGPIGPDGRIAYQDHGATGATETVSWGTDVHRLLLDSATVTLSVASVPAAPTPAIIRLLLIQDGTGGRTVAWWSGITWVNGSAPVLNSAPGAITAVDIQTVDGGVTYLGMVAGAPGRDGLDGLDGIQGAVGPSMVGVSDYSEDATTHTISSSGTSQAIISRTVTLAAGLYLVQGQVRANSMSSAGNPGQARLRYNGTGFGPNLDLRNQALINVGLAGVVAHAGGSATWDIFFAFEAGTTVFGLVSDARFAQRLLITRIGS